MHIGLCMYVGICVSVFTFKQANEWAYVLACSLCPLTYAEMRAWWHVFVFVRMSRHKCVNIGVVRVRRPLCMFVGK